MVGKSIGGGGVSKIMATVVLNEALKWGDFQGDPVPFHSGNMVNERFDEDEYDFYHLSCLSHSPGLIPAENMRESLNRCFSSF